MANLTPNPNDLPEFADQDVTDGLSGQNNVVEPVAADKDFGWHPFGRRPERNVMNWLHRFTYRSFQWLTDTFYPEVQACFDQVETDKLNNLHQLIYDDTVFLPIVHNPDSLNPDHIVIRFQDTIANNPPSNTPKAMLLNTSNNDAQLLTLGTGAGNTLPSRKRFVDKTQGSQAASLIQWAPGNDAGILAVDVGPTYNPIIQQDEFMFLWAISYIDGSETKYDWILAPNSDVNNDGIENALTRLGFTENGKRLVSVIKPIDLANNWYDIQKFAHEALSPRQAFYRFLTHIAMGNFGTTPIVGPTTIPVNPQAGQPIYPQNLLNANMKFKILLTIDVNATTPPATIRVEGVTPDTNDNRYGQNIHVFFSPPGGTRICCEIDLWTTDNAFGPQFQITATGIGGGDTAVDKFYFDIIGFYFDGSAIAAGN